MVERGNPVQTVVLRSSVGGTRNARIIFAGAVSVGFPETGIIAERAEKGMKK